MADHLDTPSFGSNFGIQDTMEMGTGNTQLLNDLFAPETSTADINALEPIIKETEDNLPEKKPVKVTTVDGDKKPEEKEPEDPSKLITDFFGQEEEETVETKTPEKKEEFTEKAPEESNRFSALAKDLFNLGVFSKEDDEDVDIKTPEEFLERFQVEKKKGASTIVSDFIGQFGEDYQDAFQAIYVKGVNPKDYFTTYNNIANFADMDLAQESNQITVIKQALLDQGFEPEDLEAEVERLKNYGDLEAVATRNHKVLVKKETAKLQALEEKAEKDLQLRQSIKNQYVNNVQAIIQDKLKTKEFDGIPINPKIAGELQDFLLVDKYKTPSGETLTDFDKTILELKKPENHATKVKLGLLLKILEKDPNLSTIQKTGITKQTNVLFSEVARQVEKTSAKENKSVDKPSSWFTT